MKKWHTSGLAAAALFLLFPLAGLAGSDSAGPRPRALPDHFKVQFAGGIGFLSAGAGYSSRDGKVDADLFYGYVPKSIGGITIHTLTAKLTYSPIKPLQYGHFKVKPFSTGALVNYSFGKQYFGFRPDNYPYDFYKFPTSLYLGAFVGGELFRQTEKSKPFSRIGLYYELVTFDRLLLSYINNRRALSITDVFSLAIGVKLGYR
ncbi:MAG TPA: hypothetical protein VFR58_00545 [Flavisolibacter sp.]|nr:hypothetical protein [Flavisolibacter sp.]